MSEANSSERVVVGVDGSEPSKRALEWARFFAGTTGATIEAVAVWGIPPYVTVESGWPADYDPETDSTTMLHRTVAEVLGDDPDVRVRERVLQGGAARVLLEISAGAQLLVVGSRGHGGFSGMLLGSVSTACAEHAECPVLVIHGTTPPPPVLPA